MPDPAPTAEPSPRRVRWLPGVVLLLLSPFFIVGAWFLAGVLADHDRTIQMVAAIAALSLAFLVQVIWWMFLARLSWRARGLGLLAVGVLAGLAVATLRFEGHTGEMLPVRIVPRWAPTPEERAVAYFRDAKSASESAQPGTAFLTVTAGDWPQYRGSNRDDVAPDAKIRTDWNEHPPKEVWKHPMGPAWSSFAVVGERLFTQEQRGEEEVVACYDPASGKQLWAHADRTRFDEALGGSGPRATPTFADGSLYALGATGILNCLDPVTGELHWTRETLRDAGGDKPIPNVEWGMAGSPLVWNRLVFVAPGGGIERGVIAYEATSGSPAWFSKGKPIWETPTKEADGKATMASYAAPRIETIGGAPHLLILDGEGLKGYDPTTGELLWSYGPWTNQPKVNAAQPIVHEDRVCISSGYTVGSALIEVKRDGDQWKATEVWRDKNEFKLKFNDAVLYDGHLYGLDEGILACYEFDTGKRKWKKGRYGYGQVILLGDTLVILAEDGTLAAVKATPDEFEEIARVPVLDGKTWNHPAWSRGFLYVRNDREGACLDLRP